MSDPLLSVPRFRRLDEYGDCWAYETEKYFALLRTIQGTDWARHLEAKQESAAQPTSTLVPANKAGKSIAIIRAEGTLMKQRSSMGGTSTIDLRRDLRQATNNADVSGILLAIDSPGGTVSGTHDLAADVKAATRKKPVVAHIIDTGASAAYWFASQADAVYANAPTALVGSIGTLLTVPDDSGAAEKTGTRFHTFASSPLKAAGQPGVEMTDERKAFFQSLVNGWQSIFAAAVQSGRRLTATQMAAAATGAVFLAADAQRLKLIDGIRPIEQTITELAKAK